MDRPHVTLLKLSTKVKGSLNIIKQKSNLFQMQFYFPSTSVISDFSQYTQFLPFFSRSFWYPTMFGDKSPPFFEGNIHGLSVYPKPPYWAYILLTETQGCQTTDPECQSPMCQTRILAGLSDSRTELLTIMLHHLLFHNLLVVQVYNILIYVSKVRQTWTSSWGINIFLRSVL